MEVKKIANLPVQGATTENTHVLIEENGAAKRIPASSLVPKVEIPEVELPKDILRYSAQELTEEQKVQARANIGAGVPVEVPEIPEQKQADWNQNDDTAPDFVKGRTHYVTDEYEYSLIADDSSAYPEELGSTQVYVPYDTRVEDGYDGYFRKHPFAECERLRIIINGNIYDANRKYSKDNPDPTAVTFGNKALDVNSEGAEDTGESFFVTHDGYSILICSTENIESFAIYEAAKKVYTLDPKFIGKVIDNEKRPVESKALMMRDGKAQWEVPPCYEKPEETVLFDVENPFENASSSEGASDITAYFPVLNYNDGELHGNYGDTYIIRRTTRSGEVIEDITVPFSHEDGYQLRLDRLGIDGHIIATTNGYICRTYNENGFPDDARLTLIHRIDEKKQVFVAADVYNSGSLVKWAIHDEGGSYGLSNPMRVLYNWDNDGEYEYKDDSYETDDGKSVRAKWLGNGSLIHSSFEDTGEPFAIARIEVSVNTDDGWGIESVEDRVYFADGANHAIEVYRNSEVTRVVKKLDEKFIPETIQRVNPKAITLEVIDPDSLSDDEKISILKERKLHMVYKSGVDNDGNSDAWVTQYRLANKFKIHEAYDDTCGDSYPSGGVCYNDSYALWSIDLTDAQLEEIKAAWYSE